MPPKPLTFMFKDDGSVPNNPMLPVLVYKSAVDIAAKRDPAGVIEDLFTANGWGHGQWRNGIYPFVHYHSMIHEVLGIAVGGKTVKMHQGHHGANHPVKDLTTGKVEITSMNHGFAVDKDSLPKNIEQTHVSLFDGSNCGIALKDKPVFSVQYHPEASPGPRDSHYLFTRFVEMMRQAKRKIA